MGFGKAHAFVDFVNFVGLEQFVDPVPEQNRFVVGNEIRFASWVVLLPIESGFGAEVRVDDIVNVAEVYSIVPVADDSEFSFAAAIEYPGDEVRIAGAPDKVWSQSDGFEVSWRLPMSGEHGFFGDDFACRIKTGNIGPVGKRFIGSGNIMVVEYDARGACVDKFGDKKITATINDGLGADDVCVVKIFTFSPDTYSGSCVENGIHISTGVSHGPGVGEIDVAHFDSERFEFWLGATAESGYGAALFEQPLNQVAAEKSTRSGNEDLPWGEMGRERI